jgi:predicted phage terminase large subunit-like protein
MKFTDKDKANLKHQIQLELCRIDYAAYCTFVHQGRWLLGRHLELICKNIERLINRDMRENILIISMPPQHGKSQCVTETLPSWYLGRFPQKRVIEVSYGDDLAQRFGRRNKDKILEFGKEIFDIELSKQSDTNFEIKTHKGSMISKGIMAGLSGNPADLIIIDDPIKNRAEAESKVYRDRIWEEFLNSVYTRLSANGIIVLIMTRWHLDDLAGRLLENMPDKCVEINIPLEAEENDILGRNIGDALFPEIGKDNDWLVGYKKVYTTEEGLRSWNALMQGRPVAQDGNMLKRTWWKYYDVMPSKFDEIIQSWDLTFKDSDGSDYVVGQVWGRIGTDKYLIDQVRDRMNFTTTVKAIIALSQKYPLAYVKLIEEKANGSAVMDVLRGRGVGGIIPIIPKESKIARVSAVSADIEGGYIYLPQFASFTNEFVNECSAFPTGTHDDMVDCMSQALYRLIFHTTPALARELPKGLPQDLLEDLMEDPRAMEHYLNKNRLLVEGEFSEVLD